MQAYKRDYVRFALMVQALEKDYYKRKAWAYEIANILQDSNPAFNRGKFIDACLDSEKEKT